MFDFIHIIQASGLLLLTAIICAEPGIVASSFFLGDNLLFTVDSEPA